ncbi:MAG: aspartate kinase [Prevotellaceae bacterium]|jgi:aspartate kinase|nr:aspartate kinase [Prevotellaceae bacterium]
MVVYKFGGAAVGSPERIRNTVKIISGYKGKLVVVVSAMAKTTDALEELNLAYAERNIDEALNILSCIRDFHCETADKLGLSASIFDDMFQNTVSFIKENKIRDFDCCYGQIVSLGELLASLLLNECLNSCGTLSRLVDARKLVMTDSSFREAKIYFDQTEKNIRDAFSFSDVSCYVTQGFIGSNSDGATTVLGREGSDYSAAIIASAMSSENLTIWKDVPGVLSADPKLFSDAELLPELSYKDAAELSYYGAQVIHPKTVKPLVAKNIPLFVKSFLDTSLEGTKISANSKIRQNTPVIASKKNQILISILPKDFSFVLDDAIMQTISILHSFNVKIHIIQSSPLCISLCADDGRNTRLAVDELKINGIVLYNNNLELITIRNYTEKLIEKYSENKERLIMQRDRSTVRMLLK